MKNKLIFSIGFFLLVAIFAKAQDGNFNTINFNRLVKSGSSTSILGWGENFDTSIDSRPNPHPYLGTMMINHHTGLTFTAHSFYGGIRFYNQGYPEAFDTSTGAKMVMSINNGKVGIGTTNPLDPLDVKDIFRISGLNRNWRMMSHVSDGNLYFRDETATSMVMTLTTSGDVGIGTTMPKEKLSVNGKIRAHEIKVETANWPDYVFENGYRVGTLESLESYIKAHKHLPEIPSAKEAEANGVALGEMNKLLLKKVEELTLLLIEQNRINKEQGQRLSALEAKK